MIVDSSALIAICFGEIEKDIFIERIKDASVRFMSVGNVLESYIVSMARYHEEGAREIDHIISRFQIEIQPFTIEQLSFARLAFRKYGKGRHPAALNFGDCIAYGLARQTGEPLLCKGADFAKTDLKLVTY